MAAATLAKAARINKPANEQLYPFHEFNAVANALDNSGLQDIFTLDVEGMRRIAIRLTVATAALTAFAISALFNSEDGTFVTLASVSGDFTAPKGLLVGASGDLTTLGIGSGWFVLDVSGLSKIKLSANCGTTATLALAGGGQ